MSARKYLVSALWALVAGLVPVSVDAAQLVIVEARGIGFAPGATVDSSRPLVLRQGQHLTLISPDGATLKLDGPYNQAPDRDLGKGVDLRTKLSALFAGGQRTGEVGTTRATGSRQIPGPWLLDISRAGTVCQREDDRNPVLWHPALPKDATITLMPNDRSWRADFQWPAGQDRLDIGATVPLNSGTTYFATMNGHQRAIIVSKVPVDLASDDMRAAWMANKGCEAQAEALLRQGR